MAGQRRAQAGYIGQQVLRSRVEVHPDPVHAAFDHAIEAFLQFRLVHIVLVLAHTDGFRVDFHQFRQRIHQPPSDRHRTPHRYIVIGKLLAGRLRRRIDGSAVLVHGINADRLPVAGNRKPQIPYQPFGFAAGRPAAHGDGFDPVIPHHAPDRFARFVIPVLRRMGIDRFVVHQISLPVEAYYFAPRPETGIDRQYVFLSQRSRQQQLPQVFREDPDRLFVGSFFGQPQQFRLDRGFYQTFVSVSHRPAHQRDRHAISGIPPHENPIQPLL